MATAEYVTKVHAICKKTGNLANYSMRISKNQDLVQLGETDSYEAVSRRVFVDDVLNKKNELHHKQIAEITQSQLIGDKNLHVQHIAFDSRNIYSVIKTAFIAINTTTNTGEKYIPQAIEKGIKIIISENFYSEYEGITWIIVEDSVKFLQDLAKYHVEKILNSKP
jgi:thymidine kinase